METTQLVMLMKEGKTNEKWMSLFLHLCCKLMLFVGWSTVNECWITNSYIPDDWQIAVMMLDIRWSWLIRCVEWYPMMLASRRSWLAPCVEWYTMIRSLYDVSACCLIMRYDVSSYDQRMFRMNYRQQNWILAICWVNGQRTKCLMTRWLSDVWPNIDVVHAVKDIRFDFRFWNRMWSK